MHPERSSDIAARRHERYDLRRFIEDFIAFSWTALWKGLKPLEVLSEISGHAMMDVAKALTFRSGNGKNT
jgi:hypothetical protein